MNLPGQSGLHLDLFCGLLWEDNILESISPSFHPWAPQVLCGDLLFIEPKNVE